MINFLSNSNVDTAMELSAITSTIQTFSAFIVAFTGLVVALSAIFKPLRNFFINRFSYKRVIEDRMDNFEKKIDQLTDFTNNLTNKFEEDKKEQSIMKEATIASTRNDLTHIYNNAIERGYIGDYDRENFMKMYRVYTELGGNSYVHELYEQILKMPRVPKTKKRTTKKPTTKRK